MPDCVVRVSIVCFKIVTTYSVMCDPFRRCMADSQIHLESHRLSTLRTLQYLNANNNHNKIIHNALLYTLL